MLEEKARDLGRLIGQSDEYKTVLRANDALREDETAVALLREMEKLRNNAQEMLGRGEEPTTEMETELEGILSKLQVAPTYQRMAVAQENFDKIMRHVNEWISDGIAKGAQSQIITLG